MRALLPIAALLAAAALVAGTAHADPQSRLSAVQARERALHGTVRSEAARLETARERLSDLVRRLAALEATLAAERAELARVEGGLRTARARLAALRATLQHDRRALAAQLVAQYEQPAPDIVTVVLDAHGWSDLLERASDLRRLARRNAEATAAVDQERSATVRATARLRALVARRQRVTAATLVQRDELASVRDVVARRVARLARARAGGAAALARVRRARAAIERRVARLAGPSGFGAHGGAFGFFPAPGTNYGVGAEPTLAARLDRLGRALHLHLIGLSGYRTPQHSVEVGGFPNDPHTHGEASDTPGVEGVPEATLRRFGLTRPFGGAAEADHIQLG